MSLTRRGALVGAAVAAVAPAALTQPARAERSFAILRDGADIGRHVTTLARAGDDLTLQVDVDIVVRILGIAAYRYAMRNTELWRDGRLVSMDSVIDDDGRRKTVRVARGAAGLEVTSDFYTGPAPDDAGTTTYFTKDFLTRSAWISTDSGEVYAMRVARDGSAAVATASGSVDCERWRATNGSDFDVALYYDARGEWASVAFDARGERATYRPDSLDGSLSAVWAG